jgi:hypothetical protein
MDRYLFLIALAVYNFHRGLNREIDSIGMDLFFIDCYLIDTGLLTPCFGLAYYLIDKD